MGVSLYIYYSVGGTIPCSAEWTLLFFFSFFFLQWSDRQGREHVRGSLG